MVERYNLETVQRDGWVPEAFLDAGIYLQTLKLKIQAYHTNNFSISTIVFTFGKKRLGMKGPRDY